MTLLSIFIYITTTLLIIITTYLIARKHQNSVANRRFASQEYELQKFSYRLKSKESELSKVRSSMYLMKEELEVHSRRLRLLEDNLNQEIHYSEDLEKHLQQQKQNYLNLQNLFEEEHRCRQKLEVERSQMAHLLFEEQKISKEMNKGIASLFQEIKVLRSLPPTYTKNLLKSDEAQPNLFQ